MKYDIAYAKRYVYARDLGLDDTVTYFYLLTSLGISLVCGKEP